MSPEQLKEVAVTLCELTNEHKLKGCILITFEEGTRHVLPCVTDENQYGQFVERVGIAIQNDMSFGEISIPPCLN